MFYTVVGPHARDQRELHVAYADALTGLWHQHALNPILTDRAGARPGGTPYLAHDGSVMLPDSRPQTFIKFIFKTRRAISPTVSNGTSVISAPQPIHTSPCWLSNV